MKTIVFYSYKGGTGRSLAIANIAICLSRLGRNVALIDLDFDAPGLHYKFGEKGKSAIEKGGALEYIFSHVEKAQEKAKDEKRLALAADVDNEPITEWTSEIQGKRTGNGIGKIHLIPAGMSDTKEYWEHLRKSEWYQMFSFATADKETRRRNATFFVEMKERIAELKPNPDFFLVDCRSGISELEAFTLKFWADTVTFFFNNNEETIECLEHGIGRLQDVQGLNLIPVLSRLPSGLDDDQVTKEIRDRLFRRVEKNPICMIHSDRDLEEGEKLRIALEGTTPNTRLAHEYVKLCAYIINTPDYNKKDIEETEKKIREAIELAKSEQVEDRVFDLKRSTGEMLNPNDGQPNVSFRTATFVQMMKELHKEAEEIVYEAGKLPEESRKAVERMFQNGGTTCGKNFGSALLHMWNASKLILDVDAKIRKWCEFDSDVGFGKFEYISASSKENKEVIRLINNFLSMKQTVNDPNLCQFMVGYIQGVLQKLWEDSSLRVDHPSNLCVRIHDEERKSCDFVIYRTLDRD